MGEARRGGQGHRAPGRAPGGLRARPRPADRHRGRRHGPHRGPRPRRPRPDPPREVRLRLRPRAPRLARARRARRHRRGHGGAARRPIPGPPNAVVPWPASSSRPSTACHSRSQPTGTPSTSTRPSPCSARWCATGCGRKAPPGPERRLHGVPPPTRAHARSTAKGLEWRSELIELKGRLNSTPVEGSPCAGGRRRGHAFTSIRLRAAGLGRPGSAATARGRRSVPGTSAARATYSASSAIQCQRGVKRFQCRPGRTASAEAAAHRPTRSWLQVLPQATLADRLDQPTRAFHVEEVRRQQSDGGARHDRKDIRCLLPRRLFQSEREHCARVEHERSVGIDDVTAGLADQIRGVSRGPGPTRLRTAARLSRTSIIAPHGRAPRPRPPRCR